METVAAMVAGMALGMWAFPPRWAKANSTATLIVTIALIFFMGVTLASREGFVESLADIGLMSVAFCIVPTALSTAFVYVLTSTFMADSNARDESKRDGDGATESSSGERVLVIGAVASLSLGIAYGLSPFEVGCLELIARNTSWILYALMFFVGVSVGMNKGILAKIRRHHFKILLVPAGTIAGTALGGALCSVPFGTDVAVGTAIASGLGWYSLSGVLMTELAGAQIGSVTFMANLLREIVSFFAIPWIARHLNYPTCIAPAGATSEDTTLSMLIRCTDEETVVLSVVNGILCSAAVPVLIALLSSFF